MANTRTLIILSVSAVTSSIKSNVHYAFCTNLLCNSKKEDRERKSRREREQGINFKTNGKVSIETEIYVCMYVCAVCVLATSLYIYL